MSTPSLREQAEQRLASQVPSEVSRSAEELLHDLQLHQIELEMQNEALRQSQVALEESRDRYLDYYEFAPVGYLTLNREGLVEVANLTAAAMLGVVRQALINRRFDTFIIAAERDRWQRQLAFVLGHGGPRRQMTLTLKGGEASTTVVQVDCLRVEDATGLDTLRVTLSDIGEHWHAEQQLRISHALNVAILNAMPASIAVLDQDGNIISVNEAWRRFARENGSDYVPDADTGSNYLAACLASGGEAAGDGQAAYNGIRAVMAGQLPSFSMEYPCDAPGKARWFSMSVTPLDLAGGGVVVAHREITERIQAVAALRESEQRFRMALRNAPVSVAVQDRDLRYIWAYNQRTARPEEILGHFDADIFTAAEAAHFSDIKRRVLDEGVEIHEQMWLERPAGRMFFDLYWEPVRDAKGRVSGVGVASVNLTPIKLAEQALQSSKAQLEAALASMADAVVISDTEGRFIHFNEAFATFHRFADKDACPSSQAECPTFLEVYAQDGSPVPHEQWAVPRALRGETAMGVEVTLRRRDTGETWTGSYNYAPVRDEAGRIVGAVVSGRDVTEQKRAQAALQVKEAQYRGVIETAADGVWVVNNEGRLIMVNDAYARRSGYSREELLGMHIAELDADESPEDVHARMEIIEREGSLLFETRHRTKGGEIWPVEVNVSYSAESGGLRFSFFRDMTDRKRAEARMQALSTEMEQVMRQHVARQTVAAIAHELNQPLNAIASYSDAALLLLRAGNPKPERLVHALESTTQQAQRAGMVVRQLLDFVSHGQVSTVAVNLNVLVRSTVGKMGQDRLEQVQSRLELEPDLAPVLADPLQVEKVLTNLIQNGIEAMRGAGIRPRDITVMVRTHAEVNLAQVTVQDNGPGIEEDVLHRIFDPFFTTKPKGLGMGLAISRAIIEAHGGQLWAESDPGSGAVFHFTLPFMP